MQRRGSSESSTRKAFQVLQFLLSSVRSLARKCRRTKTSFVESDFHCGALRFLACFGVVKIGFLAPGARIEKQKSSDSWENIGTFREKSVLCMKRTAWAGFEPATNRLTVDRSTTELPGKKVRCSNALNILAICRARRKAFAPENIGNRGI